MKKNEKLKILILAFVELFTDTTKHAKIQFSNVYFVDSEKLSQKRKCFFPGIFLPPKIYYYENFQKICPSAAHIVSLYFKGKNTLHNHFKSSESVVLTKLCYYVYAYCVNLFSVFVKRSETYFCPQWSKDFLFI